MDGMKNENQTSERMHCISCVKGTGIGELKNAIEINISLIRKNMFLIHFDWFCDFLYNYSAQFHSNISFMCANCIEIHIS